jgi:hypothetical protein
VVIWWQIAALAFDKPATPAGMPTTVGPRLDCDAEVEMGMTTIDCHVVMRLKLSSEMTITGRRPVCSEPDLGTSSAQ